MVKIIETNMIIKGSHVSDHQSRVVEAESWESYVDEFKNNKSVDRTPILGNSLSGATIPRKSKITNLVHDNFHLSCDINRDNYITRKFAYKISED